MKSAQQVTSLYESKPGAILSALIILAVGFIAYLPALKIQFLDGWWYLDWAARFPFGRYLIQFFDPAYITQGYRPVQGLYMYLLYTLFGFNPDGYHLAQNLVHAANGGLLFLLVWRLSKAWRLAFVSAIVYVVLPTYSLAVFWHAVVDPLAAFFYLSTLLLWIRFIEKPSLQNYALAFGAYILALLSKEIAVFLPLWLFLLEWWFYNVRPNWRVHIPRYLPFLVAWIPYLYLVIQVQAHGEFTGQFGFHIGTHMIGNLIPYMAALAFPWINELPSGNAYYIWAAIAALGYLTAMVVKRSKALLFLALTALLNIAPLLGFPLDYFNTRYLYLSAVPSAIVIALVFEAAWRFVGTRRVLAAIVSIGLVILVIASGTRIADAAASLAEYTRQLRVPFADISRQHPSFPKDSYLYFVNSPATPLSDLQGLFMTRYGLGMPVSGTEDAQLPALRDHLNTFVYYFDDTHRPKEIDVDRNALTRTSSALPLHFGNAIRLENIEVVDPTVKHGDPLIPIFYWRLDGSIDRDYTVFIHLTDKDGQVLAVYDGAPRGGNAPTSQWKLNQPVVDARILPVAEIAPGNEYYLQVGLYDPATTARLSFESPGQPVGDMISIGPISIQ